MLLSIIICTYNRSNILHYCLNSLTAQTLDKNLFEVVIVDNNSSDDTQKISGEYIKKYSTFHVFIEKEQGLSHARNRGWKEASGKYVAFIDDDAKVVPGFGEKVINAFKNVKPSPSVIGGKILPWYETKPPAWFCDEFETRSWGDYPHFLEGSEAKIGFSGSNMSFYKKDLEKIGGFSTEYGMIGNKIRLGEETVLFSKFLKKKLQFWYDPSIVVYHWVPKKKMTFTYNIKRSFLGGVTQVTIKDRKIFSFVYLQNIYAAIKLLIRFPFYIFRLKDDVGKRNAFIYLNKLSSQLGYLLGRK